MNAPAAIPLLHNNPFAKELFASTDPARATATAAVDATAEAAWSAARDPILLLLEFPALCRPDVGLGEFVGIRWDVCHKAKFSVSVHSSAHLTITGKYLERLFFDLIF